MAGTRGEDQEGHVIIDGDRLEIVSAFKYLGSTVTSKNSVEEEVMQSNGAGSNLSVPGR